MLTLLLSFLSGLLPSGFKIFQDWLDKRHEYKVLQLQLEQSKQVQESKIQELGMQIDLEGLKARYQTFYGGGKFIDALNGLVRPAYAYGFLLLYLVINLTYYHHLKHLPPAIFADLMWTETDETIMQAVIGFYFGAKTSEKAFG